MINLKKEYKIALTVITALVVLLWGVNFLKGKDIFDTGTVYYGIYPRLEGLTEANPVYYNGYKVGSVREIKFYPEREKKFIVTFSLNRELPVYRSTVAQIYSFDLMGSMAVQFLDGQPDELLEPGDTLQTSIKPAIMDQLATQVMPIKDKVEALIVRIDSTLSGLSGILSDTNNQSFEEGLKSFRQMMQNLEKTTAEFNTVMSKGGALRNSLANIDTISGELSRQRLSVSATIKNVEDFSEQLARLELESLAGKLDSSLFILNSLLKQAQEGEGSLGLLLSDEALYYNLMDASANLDRLLADIRLNPKRYLSISAIDFGRTVEINVDDKKAEEQGIVYKVRVAVSDKPLDIRNTMIRDKYRIFEDTDGEKYTYTVGASSSYADIKSIRDEIIHEYPEAKIIAFKEGKPVKIIKALKLSDTND
ncbi:MlaD family protein [Anaerophaga thermohalophila]|uniref:MlaD family protein n=1 Tax=Anaerophaga thermohalophila TaxID=177400 RepID=UPI000237C45A|nr:MlaD family protein [Anaerophaga thermohalophila]